MNLQVRVSTQASRVGCDGPGCPYMEDRLALPPSLVPCACLPANCHVMRVSLASTTETACVKGDFRYVNKSELGKIARDHKVPANPAALPRAAFSH